MLSLPVYLPVQCLVTLIRVSKCFYQIFAKVFYHNVLLELTHVPTWWRSIATKIICDLEHFDMLLTNLNMLDLRVRGGVELTNIPVVRYLYLWLISKDALVVGNRLVSKAQEALFVHSTKKTKFRTPLSQHLLFLESTYVQLVWPTSLRHLQLKRVDIHMSELTSLVKLEFLDFQYGKITSDVEATFPVRVNVARCKMTGPCVINCDNIEEMTVVDMITSCCLFSDSSKMQTLLLDCGLIECHPNFIFPFLKCMKQLRTLMLNVCFMHNFDMPPNLLYFYSTGCKPTSLPVSVQVCIGRTARQDTREEFMEMYPKTTMWALNEDQSLCKLRGDNPFIPQEMRIERRSYALQHIGKCHLLPLCEKDT